MRASQAFRVLGALSFVTSGLAATNSTNSTTITSLLADEDLDFGVAAEAYAKAKAFVATLNNTQKISIITGGSFTGASNSSSWTAYTNKDGGAGINFQFFVSGFSMINALTMTWDRNLIEQQFKAVGSEFYGMGYNLIDGPEPGPLGRVPYGGRQPEAFSVDPYLTGIAMGKAVSGMQSAGVIAVGRHFLLNEQETNRSASTSSSTTAVYSSNADDKTTHELYIWPFADGVNAGMMATMCAMNRVNDTLSCENNKLLSGYLKAELGFPGLVMPDAGAQSTAFGSANAGLDFGSSSLWSESTLTAGITNGSFTQERLDDMAIRNVVGYYYVGLDDGKQPSEASTTEYRDVRGDHASLIRQIGGQAIVLLKNSNSSGLGLPLNKPRTISLFGAHAGPALAGPNVAFSVQGTPSDIYEGHLAGGSGSGSLSFSYLVTPFQSLSDRAKKDGSMIWWIMNNTYSSTTSSSSSTGGGMGGGMGGSAPTGSDNSTSGGSAPTGAGGDNSTTGGAAAGGGGVNLGNLGQGTAVTISFENYAANSAACLVFINSYSGEGGDRSELSDDDQDTMVQTVAANCNNTIVVANTAGPRVLDAWIENDNVTAVIYSGLLGQESGDAIADVLYGDVNPSGKLTYTIAKNASDYNVGVCETAECDFDEGVYVDYRYFDQQNMTVRYPFGHGLSYTTFSYGPVSSTVSNSSSLSSKYPTGGLTLGGASDLFEEVVVVKTSITNTGTRDGAEVAQLYVSFPAEAEQPVRILRGFEKVHIKRGSSADVQFSLRRRDLSYWDTTAQKWAVARGEYTFAVGTSSRDLKGTTKITV